MSINRIHDSNTNKAVEYLNKNMAYVTPEWLVSIIPLTITGATLGRKLRHLSKTNVVSKDHYNNARGTRITVYGPKL